MTDVDQQKVTIEQTSKKLKLIRAIGIVLLLLGAGVAISTADQFGVAEGWPSIISFTLVGIGIVVYGTGCLMSWWQHG
jgi:hypothetical protein